MSATRTVASRALALVLLAGCNTPPLPVAGAETDAGMRVTRQTHPFFPVVEGVHAVDCSRCHDGDSFTQFNCTQAGCHPCEATAPRHPNLGPAFVCESPKCYECHPKGVWP